MKHKLLGTIFLVLFTQLATAQNPEEQFIKENLDFAVLQAKHMLETPPMTNPMPHSFKQGKLGCNKITSWTAGFFPGLLWYLNEYSGDKALKDSARVWTGKMESVKTYTGNHDIGFMINCSYGNALRITHSGADKDILIQAAKSLTTRFSPVTGTIKSWNAWGSLHDGTLYNYPVIIDNMMNLELLFVASRLSGDDSFKKIAVQHAENTMRNHIRNDGSSFHVALYDAETGKFIKGETAQGYSDNSAWARGQSWAIYGFTMVYRETKDPRFLQTAMKAADYYINNPNLPSDKICWWDFNAYQPGFTPGERSAARKLCTNYRDASAAAITASALLELSTFTNDRQSETYRTTAIQILHSLGSPVYRAKERENGNFILLHSVGSLPGNSEIDVPLIYADYYFVEALSRYDALLKHKPLPVF